MYMWYWAIMVLLILGSIALLCSTFISVKKNKAQDAERRKQSKKGKRYKADQGYYPLPHVRTLYYMNVDLYRYFIGREDQSVNEKVMISRIDQQLFVTKKMISMYELRLIGSKKLRKYMVNYLAIMMTVSSILCIRSKKKENLEKKKELWAYLKKKDYRTYMKIRYGILGQTMNLPGRSGRRVSSLAYTVARRLIGFN